MSIAPSDERGLAAFVGRVLEAGDRFEVYVTRETPGASRDLAGRDWLSVYDHAHARYPASAVLACFDDRGEVRAIEVDDLGKLARALHPALDPSAFVLEFRCRPPVSITAEHARGLVRRYRIELFSDVWMPWVWDFLELEGDCRYPSGEPFSNRELAGRHTPRLNDFLTEVRDAAREAAGELAVDTEWGSPFYYAACVGASGIDLDARPR